MATSQNGYSANDRSVIATYTVPGTTLKIALRKGDVSVVLLEYLRRYHLEVESLYHTPQDLWGYAERTIRGSSTTLSNHASGTSVDARAVKNALGKTGTFTAAQVKALNNLLAWFEGVLRHGKDFSGRKDPMHAEINKGPAEVARIANKIRNAGLTPAAPPAPGSGVLRKGAKGQAVTDAQNLLTAAGFPVGRIDGDFGDKTLAAVKAFQTAHGLVPDGEIGPKTWAALRSQEDDLPSAREVADVLLDTPINREGDVWHAGQPTSLRAIIGWLDHLCVNGPWSIGRGAEVHRQVTSPAPAPTSYSNVTAAQVVDELLRRLKEAP